MNNLQVIKIITVLTSIFYTGYSNAQIFTATQNPPSIIWHQINTENFQIIFPSSIENDAQRMANTLEVLIDRVSFSLNKPPRKISIILQNQGTAANGFVQLAPRRSEFFNTPPQEFDYQDWLNSLAVHELRHIVQFDKLAGYFKAPLEDIALTIFGVTLPPWFYEGDAVGIETALTKAGRGRQPEWDIIFRSNTLSGKKFSYSKDFLGSIRDFTPGYYQLGYYQTTKLRRDYGSGILDSLYLRMSANPFRPYNLNNSIKKFTGLNTSKLHASTIEELEKFWQEQQDLIKPKAYPILNRRIKNHGPESFLIPTIISAKGELLFLKESKAKTPRIVRIDSSGKEHTVIKIGAQEEPYFTYSSGRITWDEFRFDKRYHQRSFNVINLYDLKTNSYRQLTHRSRMFAPALSPDGRTIAAIEISYSNQISIVEISSETGKELKRFPSPENYMLQTPKFDSTGEKIVVAAVSQSGKTMFELDKKTGVFTQLLPFQKQLLSRPIFVKDNIVFKAHYNGIDNLYQLNRSTKKIIQLTSVKFGAFNPFFDDKTSRIYFNNYQINGHDISYIPFEPDEKDSSNNTKSDLYNQYINPLVLQEGNKDAFSDIPQKKFPEKPFKERNNLFYFHSLIPVVEENNYNDYNFALKLQSDNKLNTLSFYTGYRFNNGLKKSEYLAGFTFSRFYPILDVSYTNQARLIYRKNVINGITQLTPVTWRENVVSSEITVPVLFNQLNHTYNLNFKVGTSYTARYDVTNGNRNFIRVLDFPMHYQAIFSHSNRRSARDLAPVWGQNLTLTYRHFPFEKQVQGKLFTFKSNFYFPGAATNHSLQASFNYQNGNGSYAQIHDIPLVSGYSNLRPTLNLRNTLLLDYRFPLFYPDWELGPVAYIKRIKAGLFSDFENIGKGDFIKPRTYGFELRADMNLLRFYLPNFDIGGKIIFVNEKPKQNPIFESTVSYIF
jgi:hypothetical protein